MGVFVRIYGKYWAGEGGGEGRIRKGGILQISPTVEGGDKPNRSIYICTRGGHAIHIMLFDLFKKVLCTYLLLDYF